MIIVMPKNGLGTMAINPDHVVWVHNVGFYTMVKMVGSRRPLVCRDQGGELMQVFIDLNTVQA